jgi:hypothetical protein
MKSLYRRKGDGPINQHEDQPLGEYQLITRWTHEFSLEVHVLAGTLVPVVSTNTCGSTAEV